MHPPNERNKNRPRKSLETFISSKQDKKGGTNRVISIAGCFIVTMPKCFPMLPLWRIDLPFHGGHTQRHTHSIELSSLHLKWRDFHWGHVWSDETRPGPVCKAYLGPMYTHTHTQTYILASIATTAGHGCRLALLQSIEQTEGARGLQHRCVKVISPFSSWGQAFLQAHQREGWAWLKLNRCSTATKTLS